MRGTKAQGCKEAGINGVVVCLPTAQNLRRECRKIRRDQIIIYSKGPYLDKEDIKNIKGEGDNSYFGIFSLVEE